MTSPVPYSAPPENLLVSANGELKISDFGCSRMADGKTAQQRLSGTPAFTAPELVNGTSSDPFAADVWAMGACLYCFIYGQLPFQVRPRRAMRGAFAYHTRRCMQR